MYRESVNGLNRAAQLHDEGEEGELGLEGCPYGGLHHQAHCSLVKVTFVLALVCPDVSSECTIASTNCTMSIVIARHYNDFGLSRYFLG